MSENNRKVRLGISMGDANGISPELILKVFSDNRMHKLCTPILYGSGRVLNIYRKVLRMDRFNYNVIQNPGQAHTERFNLVECVEDIERVDIGQPSEVGARVAYEAFKRAVEDAMHQHLDALVTLPVDKSTFQKLDPEFTGHTGRLAEAFNAQEELMLMVSDVMRVGLVTHHIPINKVPVNISKEGIVRKASLLNTSLENDFAIRKPMIAVLALNPHAGDDGLIGKEEQEVISPAIKELNENGIQAMGPYPADGFFASGTYKRFDGILAMYHDQGLIPFKSLAGYSGVNYTAGLPLVRTSPDHGVAYDIAGKGEADPESFRQSIYMAIDIIRNRREHAEISANPLPYNPGGKRRRER